jgi:hypothetical protein
VIPQKNVITMPGRSNSWDWELGTRLRADKATILLAGKASGRGRLVISGSRGEGLFDPAGIAVLRMEVIQIRTGSGHQARNPSIQSPTYKNGRIR